MRDDAFLDDCLIDGEAGTRRRRSSMRQRAVAAALIFEGILVTGLALWPLFTPATPPPRFMITSVPYLSGARLRRTMRVSGQNVSRTKTTPVPDFSRLATARVMRTTGSAIQNTPIPAIPDSGPQAFDGILGAPKSFGGRPLALSAPANLQVIRRSEQIQESQLVTRVTPAYPEIARAAHITGTVELLVVVGRDGSVLSVQVLRGNPLLAAAAKQAVEQWRYRPAIVDGRPVEVEARVTVNFVMDE